MDDSKSSAEDSIPVIDVPADIFEDLVGFTVKQEDIVGEEFLEQSFEENLPLFEAIKSELESTESVEDAQDFAIQTYNEAATGPDEHLQNDNNILGETIKIYHSDSKASIKRKKLDTISPIKAKKHKCENSNSTKNGFYKVDSDCTKDSNVVIKTYNASETVGSVKSNGHLTYEEITKLNHHMSPIAQSNSGHKLQQEISNIRKSEKKKLKTIKKRKDLEDLIIEQVVEKLLYEHELGSQRELCKRLESALETNTKKAMVLAAQVADLQKVTRKLAKEYESKRQSGKLSLPLKVRRSVGVQSTPSLIVKNVNQIMRKSPSNVIIPTKYKDILPGKRKRKSHKYEMYSYDDDSMTDSESDSESSSEYDDLQRFSNNKKCKPFAKRPPSFFSMVHINGTIKSKDGSKISKSFASKPKKKNNDHPAPLPRPPAQLLVEGTKPFLPAPSLSVSNKDGQVCLEWDLDETEECENIAGFEIFVYKEGNSVPSTRLWKKVGTVEALQLPMACTLTHFDRKNFYHFAIRAVDVLTRLGKFSEPTSFYLS